MPPVRRRKSSAAPTAPPNDVNSLANLRQRCAEKGLSVQGRRATLLSRLQQHAAESTSEIPTRSPTGSTELQQPESSQILLSDDQLAQIQSIVTRTVEQSANEIATSAARAAVAALTSEPSASSSSVDQVTATEPAETAPLGSSSDPTAAIIHSEGMYKTPYAHGFQDVPAAYVKQIQTGEFFDLAKLLPSNYGNLAESEQVTLTLENSVLKVKKSSHCVARITEIEPWTTAFSTYMSVLTHKFPHRAQELLQYMSLIRYAARTHRGLGWCVYDHKFRQKASLNPSLNWSDIDQQLWLIIFTVSPDVLRRENPLFHHGPQKSGTSGGERGICIEYNRRGECSHPQCRYQHICSQCSGLHARRFCGKIYPKPTEDPNNHGTSKRNHRSARSKN